MKTRSLFLRGLLAASLLVSGLTARAAEPLPPGGEWFPKARFGMFIHWGLYSVPAQKEWYMAIKRMSVENYAKFAAQFNPTQFDAAQWIGLAKAAGMQYLTITTKHHDGFAMFATKQSPYNVVEATPWGQDPMRLLSDECRKEGIHFCAYYSITDWHHPSQHPPAEASRYGHYQIYPDQKADYQAYQQAQLTELVKQYDPDLFWFDGAGGETWWTPADGKALVSYLRGLKPSLVVNNRVKGGGYETWEKKIPPVRLPSPWECCMTINDSWGYTASDVNWKSAPQLVQTLADVASKGGNFLLNVGPTAQGVIPQPEVERLQAIGQWLKVNGEAIYGTEGTPFAFAPEWGRVTQAPGKLYLHVFTWPADHGLLVNGLKNRVTKAYLLSDSAKNPLSVATSADGISVTLPEAAPDPGDSVVVLEIEGSPDVATPWDAAKAIALAHEVKQAQGLKPGEQ
jgi:alpha-L-fucosidase